MLGFGFDIGSASGPFSVPVLDFTKGGTPATYARSGSGTALTADGSVVHFSPNQPRVTDRGILIEAQKTNFIPFSSDIDNSAWLKAGASVTANAVGAPDGSPTAELVLLGPGEAYVYRTTLSGMTSGQPCTASFWARAVSAPHVLGVRSGQSGLNSTRNLTTSWQRFTWTFNAGGTTEVIQFVNSALVAAAATTINAYIWGVQCEPGNVASSYVPTPASQNTATRGADAATVAFPSWAQSATVAYDGGSLTVNRGDLADASAFNIGANSGRPWVGKYVQKITFA